MGCDMRAPISLAENTKIAGANVRDLFQLNLRVLVRQGLGILGTRDGIVPILQQEDRLLQGDGLSQRAVRASGEIVLPDGSLGCEDEKRRRQAGNDLCAVHQAIEYA